MFKNFENNVLSTIYGLAGVFMAGLGYKLWRGSQMPHALAIAKAKAEAEAKAKAFVCLSIDLGQSN